VLHIFRQEILTGFRIWNPVQPRTKSALGNPVSVRFNSGDVQADGVVPSGLVQGRVVRADQASATLVLIETEGCEFKESSTTERLPHLFQAL